MSHLCRSERELTECLETLLVVIQDRGLCIKLMTPEFHQRCIDALEDSEFMVGSPRRKEALEYLNQGFDKAWSTPP